MKKQRIFSLLFAFLLAFTLSFSAVAAPQSAVVTVESKENPVNAGEDVTLKVSISGNPGFTNLEWNIEYDTNRLELKAISTDRVVTVEGSNISVPYMTGSVEKNVKHPLTGYGFITRADSTAKNDDGTLFLLTFLVKQNAPSGSAFVKINSDVFENNNTSVDVSYEAASVAVNGTTGGSTTGGSTTGGSTTGGSTTGGSTTGGSTTGGSTTGGSTTGGSTTGGSTTGGSTTGGSTTGGSTTGGSTTGGSTTGGSTTGGSTTGGSTTGGSTTGGSTTGGSTAGGSTTGGSTTGGSTTGGSTTGGSTTGGSTTGGSTTGGSTTGGSTTGGSTTGGSTTGGGETSDEYTITFNGNGGIPSVANMTTVGKKISSLPTATHSGSYSFAGWYTATSGGIQITTAYKFSDDMMVYAHWTYTGGGGSYSGGSSNPTYPVSTPDKVENGSVVVSPNNASEGDTVTVTVRPDRGYTLDGLVVIDKNGNELKLTEKGNGQYTFIMPAGKVEIKASFIKEIETSPFTDVKIDAYYYEAVKWAQEKGITSGIGDNQFGPERSCTRAQIVTFLWRAAGSPAPKGAAAGMTDVVTGSYYEKAVAWAIENGITTGTTAATFSPDDTCTRAQAVTFLARALNAKAASAAEFSDVPTGSYFANAVAWAAANGVTEGIGGGLFAPDNDCTRGQIVTFLWRAYNK